MCVMLQGASAEELARLARAKREKLRQAASSAEEFISLDSSAVPLSATTPLDDIGTHAANNNGCSKEKQSGLFRFV